MSKRAVETPLMQQYYRIKDKHPDARLLFRVGDFYETFSEDALVASRVLGITLTRRANGSAQFVELAGFPHHALDSYLPKLVRAGHRVAICDQLEDPKQTKKLVKRGITELVTPGVVLGDNVLSGKENNYLASVYLDQDRAGLSLFDISTGEFLCSEGSIEHIDKLIASYQPKELLVERNQKLEVGRRLSYRGFTFDLDDWSFAIESNKKKIQTHFGVHSLKGFGAEHLTLALAAAGAILNYMELTSHNDLQHVTTLRCIDRSDFLRLDGFTLRSLEILHPMNSSEGKSLLDIIDFTSTPMGGRLLRRWLVFPLIEVGKIRERQEIAQALLTDESLRRDIRERLAMMGDMERLATKVAVGRIGPRDVNQLKASLSLSTQIRQLMLGHEASSLDALGNSLDDCSDLCDLIEQMLLPDAPIALGRGPVIANGVNAELDELRRLSSGGKDYLQHIQQRESEQTGIPSLKIAFNNVFGYYIEVRNTYKDKVPAEWIRKQTLVNAERYITAELKDYEEKILGAEDKIAIIENQLFAELVQELSKYITLLQRNAQALAQIDCLASFAETASLYGYVMPEVNDSKEIHIEEGRHPVIERQLPFGQQYIPNDVELNDDKQQIMVITGPNMSGKSALLRQTALITLLAQIGAFVPAKSARIGIVDAIFTRVGASDNISRGESTFMVEMQEASSILNNLTPRSLILFDELGRGTSTYDGISIAWSIVEYLHDNPRGRAKTLFATHYHELNDLEERLERVKNFNVSAKEVDGQMLFLRKLVPGGSEHSFGIQVARLGGMPQWIVSRANDILAQLEQDAKLELSDDTCTEGCEPSEGKRTKRLKESSLKDGIQLSLFQLDDPLLENIRDMLLKVDVNNLTPLEALNKLSEIQAVLKMPK